MRPRDCAAQNILMDGSAIYKDGWHPMAPHRTRDGRWPLSSRIANRTHVNVKYYFIDFSLSTQFDPSQRNQIVTGKLGRIQAPEQKSDNPYDPFKLDVFYLGHVFKTKIVDVCAPRLPLASSFLFFFICRSLLG